MTTVAEIEDRLANLTPDALLELVDSDGELQLRASRGAYLVARFPSTGGPSIEPAGAPPGRLQVEALLTELADRAVDLATAADRIEQWLAEALHADQERVGTLLTPREAAQVLEWRDPRRVLELDDRVLAERLETALGKVG